MVRSRGSASSRPFALTLVEVLVLLAILLALVGLMLPALHKVRVAAARTASTNNLKRIGQAAHAHYDAFGMLPHNGGFRDGQPHPLGPWGYADPQAFGLDQSGSWAYALLPFLGQKAVFSDPDGYAVGLKVFACPGRRDGRPETAPPDDPWYVGGGRNPWSKTDYAINLVLVGNIDAPPVLVRSITDGISMTVFAGQKSMDPRRYHTGEWFWDEPIFSGGSGGTGRSGSVLRQDEPGVDFADNWGGAFPCGALFVMCDGSVRMVRYGYDLRPLLTPSGHEPTTGFE